MTFSAHVEHEPTAERQVSVLRVQLANRKEELAQLASQEAELAISEETLARRPWEVQETRRRNQAMAAQIEQAAAELEEALAGPGPRVAP